eukprot:GFUD01020107.1.p1 GENE.GFUD01020107.1~~GFUD01020107.1.p1  ORF type:complete len:1017 (+),score=252.41 GFUD01020107.1:102-3152(+)
MSNTSFNAITETYTVKPKSDKNKQFENIFEEVANSDENRDLVLLCGKEKLSYHSEVVAAVFPFVKKFVQNAKSCPCSLYIQNKAEIFISLDDVDPMVMKLMMSCIYGNKPMRFSRPMLGEVRNIFKMLGADEKLFSIEKEEAKRTETKARNGDVFRNVLGAASSLDITIKRKGSDGDESERVAKRRVVDINMKDEEEPVPEKKEEPVPEKKGEPVPENKEKPIDIDDNSLKQTSIITEPSNLIENIPEPVKPEAVVEPPVKQDTVVELILKENIPFAPKEREIIRVPQKPREIIPVPQKPREVIPVPQKPKDTNLQMILPHLTVTTIKQEPKEAAVVNAQQMPEIKQEPVEYTDGTTVNPPPDSNNSMLRCPLALCSSEILFKTRAEILLHLTQAHYTEGLLELFPFIRGQPCKICVDEKRPRVMMQQIKNRYVGHIGVNHEVVLDLLPAELKEVLMVLPKRMQRSSSNRRPETPMSKPEVSITLDETPAPVLPAAIPPAQTYQSYPSTYNYNYPPTTNYHEQPNYPTPTYPPPTSYPAYPDYNQYPATTPAYPSYGNYSFEAASAGQAKAETGPTTIKDESKNLVKEEPAVVIKQEPADHTEVVYKCTLCTARSFNQRSDLLFHLSITHFSRNLNQLYPFKDNQVCSLCNMFKPKNMSSHISHMGLKHEEVIKFLPTDLASTLAPPSGDLSSQPSSAVKPLESPVDKPKLSYSEVVALPPPEKPVQKPVEIPAAAPAASDPEEPTVQCSLCQANNKVRLFTKRSEFLKHLSLLHFGKALLQAFPFAEGKNCNLCFETSKKMYTPSKKEVHVCHVGVLHAKIFELLPKEILQQVMEMPTLKKVGSTLERAMQNPQARRQEAEQNPPNPVHGTVPTVGTPTPTQSVKTDLPNPSPGQSFQTQNFAAPSLPQTTPVTNYAPPPQNFLPPTPVSAPVAPRDVVFKLPITTLPSKDDFKMPMGKTDKPYNCRYCVSGFDVAKDLKDHLLTHKSQFSQINQTPRKVNPSSLVHLRMNTPRK